jgi:hypothetical protein
LGIGLGAARSGLAAGTLGVSEIGIGLYDFSQNGDAAALQQHMGGVAAGNLTAAGGIKVWKSIKANEHTGRSAPNNLHEQLAMKEALSRPTGGKQIVHLDYMNDPRWPGAEGWEKRAQHINGIQIHYNRNIITNQIRDAKFIDKK